MKRRRQPSAAREPARVVAPSIVESDAVLARIDWCEPSAKHLQPTRAMKIVAQTLGAPFTEKGWVVDRSDERWFVARGEYGAMLRSDRVGSRNRSGEFEPWTSVRLPGRACGAVGTLRVLDLVEAFERHGGSKLARLDVALDDITRNFTPREFAERCVDGRLDDEKAGLRRDVVTRVRPRAWDWSRREEGCFWLGSKGGARLLRVYDKGAESKGALDAVRVELQTRDRAATRLAGDLLRARRNGEHLARVMAGHLVGFVDIRVPTGSRSASATWPRAPWWEAFVGRVERAVIGPPLVAAFDAWEAERARQLRSFLEIQLQRVDSSLEEWEKLTACDPTACKVFGELMALIRGGSPVRLSGRLQARLDEARERDRRGRS